MLATAVLLRQDVSPPFAKRERRAGPVFVSLSLLKLNFSPPSQGGGWGGYQRRYAPQQSNLKTAPARSLLVRCINKTRQLAPPNPPLQRGGEYSHYLAASGSLMSTSSDISESSSSTNSSYKSARLFAPIPEAFTMKFPLGSPSSPWAETSPPPNWAMILLIRAGESCGPWM